MTGSTTPILMNHSPSKSQLRDCTARCTICKRCPHPTPSAYTSRMPEQKAGRKPSTDRRLDARFAAALQESIVKEQRYDLAVSLHLVPSVSVFSVLLCVTSSRCYPLMMAFNVPGQVPIPPSEATPTTTAI